MFVGAFILGIFTIPNHLPSIFLQTMTDPSTILLALTVGMIPIIGSVLKTSGHMDNLIRNMRVGKRTFLMLSPALIGLLPMPGGALLSAPLMEKGGEGLSNDKLAGSNVWFRHTLYFIYPLAPALIISAKVAQINLYLVLPYLFLPFVLCILLGYVFFIKDIKGKTVYEEDFSMKNLSIPLVALLIAPFLDAALKSIANLPFEELATFVGVLVSLLISLIVSKTKMGNFGQVIRMAKPWSFATMMLGIIFFLNVFKSSSVLNLIMDFHITKEILCILGFLLGFSTGRIITPSGVLFPILIEKFGEVSNPTFTALYFSIFLGYIITPVHPCVSLSARSFKIGIKDYFKIMARPTLIALFISFIFLYF